MKKLAHGGSRMGAGRPPKYGKKMIRVEIYLTAAHIKKARGLGKGKGTSAGIRFALDTATETEASEAKR